MPMVQEGHAVGVVNGILYTVGGQVGTYSSTLQAYDPVGNTWSTKAPMPTARYEPTAGVVDGILYVVGGSRSGNLSTVEAYDPASNTWSTKAPMPTARYYLSAGVMNEVLYAVGGYNDTNSLSTFEAYDPTSDIWTGLPPMPTARIPAAGVVNGVLYAVGGNLLSTVEAFTPTWPGAAQLYGGNLFTGNQTVNGTVNATNFAGNGSGLTGIAAVTSVNTGAGLAGGPITTSGTISIPQAGVTNAMLQNSSLTVNSGPGLAGGATVALGGMMTLGLDASFTDARYLRLSGGTLTGGLSVPSLNAGIISTGNLGTGVATIGGGTPILEHLSLTYSLNVAGLNPVTCAPLQTFTLTGASDGDSLVPGIPNSLVSPTATGSGILIYSAWVSAADTITIRVCNVNPSGPKSKAVSGTIRVDIWKH